jgi:hypothetical protein
MPELEDEEWLKKTLEHLIAFFSLVFLLASVSMSSLVYDG